MKKSILAIALTVTGCAALRASQAKNAALERSVQAFTYQKPCGDVWAAARAVLFGQDFQVKSADAAAGLTLETEWKYDKDGSADRYLIQGIVPAEGTCQVVATKASKSAQGRTFTSRDWRMEWNLLQQVDSASANKLEQDADAVGEVARNQE